jgi:heptosyltransferase-1
VTQSNTSPKFLLVKLSSLGDVIHNLPIVWDIRRQYPDAQIDWVVEEAYVDLLMPLQTRANFKGIDRIISIGLRRWKRNIFKLQNWRELFQFISLLKTEKYDEIIDSQGLLKSAIVASLARKTPRGKVTGLANATEHSGYEPLARTFYNESVQVPKQCHAVDRSRYLLSSAISIPLIDRTYSADFYPGQRIEQLVNLSHQSALLRMGDIQKPYVLCFHATAREAKKWSQANWIAVGQHLVKKGFTPIFPWGNLAEKKVSQEIVIHVAGAIVPTAYSIQEYFQIITEASLSIGVDTGLTHLSAVLKRPTIEIYCDSPLWKTEGYWSSNIINLGDIGQPPSATSVIQAIDQLLPTH